jgi:hypothetical protein
MKPSGRAREVAEALGLSRVTVGGPTRERRPKRAAPCRTLGEPRGVVRSRRDRYGQCVCLSVCTSMWLVLPGFSGFFVPWRVWCGWFPPHREIGLGKTRTHLVRELQVTHTVVPRVDPHARVRSSMVGARSSMVGAPMRLPPRTRVTTLHTSLNRRIQSTEPSGATSSPSAQGGTGRILEDAIRAREVVCVIFVVRSPTPRLPRGSLVAPGRERRGRRM